MCIKKIARVERHRVYCATQWISYMNNSSAPIAIGFIVIAVVGYIVYTQTQPKQPIVIETPASMVGETQLEDLGILMASTTEETATSPDEIVL